MKNSGLPSWILLSAGYVQVGPEWNYRDVCSPFMRLYYITEGEGHIIFPDHTVVMTPGNLYIVPPYTRHSNYCPERMCQYYLHIYENLDGESTPVADRWIFPESVRATPASRAIFEKLLKQNPMLGLYNHDPKKYDNHLTFIDMVNSAIRHPLILRIRNNAMISLLMAGWLEHSRQRSDVKNASVAKVIRHLHRHLADSISLTGLADMVSVSPHHLARLFRQETGLSVGAYVRYLRMRRAQIALMHTTTSIKTIASETGYEDYNYFIRMFKKETGMTPAAYRRQGVAGLQVEQPT